jgi:AtzE family amidohydrolase
MIDILDQDATTIAAAVRARKIAAADVTIAAIERIKRLDGRMNAFTAVLAESALKAARGLDQRLQRGENPGPLTGVPFSVKNLFDVAGLTTLAGSKIRRGEPPAAHDATLVARMRSAGAILVGVNNMDEYAYGFTTENAHYGPTRNPHDTARLAGGSSGGSAAAIAAGMVPLSLGTDTNGSIRVPASLCGIFGLRPTFGRLSRAGAFPFVHDLDHVGPFSRTVRDLALAYDILQGEDETDPLCANRPVEPTLTNIDVAPAGMRVGILDGWFADTAAPEALAAVDLVAAALGGARPVSLAWAAEMRSAAFCLTAASGATLHLSDLRSRPQDFDPATRDRFLAGALLPASVSDRARQLRRIFFSRTKELFRDVDVLLAPATPCVAPKVGQKMFRLGDSDVPLRPNLGVYTQPLGFIGMPIVTVPTWPSGLLPIGVQIVAAPWREGLCLQIAAHLERLGTVGSRAVIPITSPKRSSSA